MKLKLGNRYYAYGHEYQCTYHATNAETGESMIVDVFVDGGLSDELIDQDLKGREVEVEWTHPYISIAHGVKILPEKENA